MKGRPAQRRDGPLKCEDPPDVPDLSRLPRLRARIVGQGRRSRGPRPPPRRDTHPGRVVGPQREGLALGSRSLESGRFGGAIDNVSGTLLGGLLRHIRPLGAIVAIGNAAGAELQTSVYPFILRGVSLLGLQRHQLSDGCAAPHLDGPGGRTEAIAPRPGRWTHCRSHAGDLCSGRRPAAAGQGANRRRLPPIPCSLPPLTPAPSPVA